MEENKMSVAPT